MHEKLGTACQGKCGNSKDNEGRREDREGGEGRSLQDGIWEWTVAVSRGFAAAIAAELAIAVLALFALLLSVALFVFFPGLMPCGRWGVHVDVLGAPPVKHMDPEAPFDVKDLIIVTGKRG